MPSIQPASHLTGTTEKASNDDNCRQQTYETPKLDSYVQITLWPSVAVDGIARSLQCGYSAPQSMCSTSKLLGQQCGMSDSPTVNTKLELTRGRDLTCCFPNCGCRPLSSVGSSNCPARHWIDGHPSCPGCGEILKLISADEDTDFTGTCQLCGWPITT